MTRTFLAPRLLSALALACLVHCDNTAEVPPASYPPPPPPPEAVSGETNTPDVAAAGASFGGANEVMLGEDGAAYSDSDPSALTDFRGTLEPYGAWVDDPNYGTVWVPSAAAVGADFVPYQSGGHWVYGDDYVWVSDYEWGWVPFHYGRWVFIEGRGWVWVPGRVYRGAWVVWRTGDEGYGYVGWAPAPPLWFWYGGYAVGVGFVIAPRYVYCPTRDVFAPGVGTHVVAGPQVAAISAHTHPYAAASPGVATGAPAGGGSWAGRAMVGPPPSRLGIAPAQVPHPTGNEAGLSRAQAFATPSTAVGLGAHAPTPAVHATAGIGPSSGRGSMAVQGAGPGRAASPSVAAPRAGGPTAPPVNAAPAAPHTVAPAAPRGGRGGGRGGHR